MLRWLVGAEPEETRVGDLSCASVFNVYNVESQPLRVVVVMSKPFWVMSRLRNVATAEKMVRRKKTVSHPRYSIGCLAKGDKLPVMSPAKTCNAQCRKTCGSPPLVNRIRRGVGLMACIGGLLQSSSAYADLGGGTLVDPIRVDLLPFKILGTTVDGESSINSYSCATSTDESGPEIIYRVPIEYPMKLTAWVEGDNASVDIDVHILTSLDLSGDQASSCVARGNRIAEAELDSGYAFVVVDSYSGASKAGPFVLSIDGIGAQWRERELYEGVVVRSWRGIFEDLGPQMIHELVIDLNTPGLSVRALAANGCQTVPSIGANAGAIAGINGGYFDTATCAPVSLLKSDGVVLGTSASSKPRGAFGILANNQPAVAVLDPSDTWAEAQQAHGGGPTLVLDGNVQQGSTAWAAEGISNASFLAENPRTVAGVDANGLVHLVAIDGRDPDAAGLSLDNLAQFANTELGMVQAVNLDGGGSTTLWVEGMNSNGVLNYPSDAVDSQPADHSGLRSVSGGFFVFSQPKNHPPRFVPISQTNTAINEVWVYDVDAIDLDLDSFVFSLNQSPDGMTIDASSGVISWSVPASSWESVSVTVQALDERGASSELTFELTVQGGLPGQGGAAGSSGGMGGLGGSMNSGATGGTSQAGTSTGANGGANQGGNSGVGGNSGNSTGATAGQAGVGAVSNGGSSGLVTTQISKTEDNGSCAFIARRQAQRNWEMLSWIVLGLAYRRVRKTRGS